MLLKKKDENDLEGLCISSVYNEIHIDEEMLIKNTYANMHLLKNNKILSGFIHYNKKNELINIHLRVLSSKDKMYRSSEIITMAEYLRKKRGLKIESNKIGRNDLCPCGSGKKYKKCCLKT